MVTRVMASLRTKPWKRCRPAHLDDGRTDEEAGLRMMMFQQAYMKMYRHEMCNEMRFVKALLYSAMPFTPEQQAQVPGWRSRLKRMFGRQRKASFSPTNRMETMNHDMPRPEPLPETEQNDDQDGERWDGQS